MHSVLSNLSEVDADASINSVLSNLSEVDAIASFKTVLVTGGLGFIGSHVVIELLQQNHKVIIIDNESNSNYMVLGKISRITNKFPTYYKLDMMNLDDLLKIFSLNTIDCVIHLAGLKSVKESVEQPINYYRINMNILLNLLDVMSKYQVHKLIFSSSATVYGSIDAPFTENMNTGQGITNSYGKTKYFQEEIIKDYVKVNPLMSVTILRYFNPIGAHPSGLLQENPATPPQNLMPILIKVANRETQKFCICGTDYDTPDGTCIRDYIHIVDLARAHTKALIKLEKCGLNIYNIGTGVGVSVKEIIRAFEKANNLLIPVEYADRRVGDLPVCFANVAKAELELGWKSELGLEEMCRDSWMSHTIG